MNTASTASGQAPVLKFLGMPPSVRAKFDALVSGQAGPELIENLAIALVCETPVTNLQLILVPLLQAYHQVYAVKAAVQREDVAREFPIEASTNDVPHWDTPTPEQEI